MSKTLGKEVIIALDQGSGSSRALAFDNQGQVAARVQVPVKTVFPKPGWAEHSSKELVRSQEEALDAVLSRLPKACEVVALGIASQRSTLIPWDARSGKPIGPAISWQDGRASESMAGLGAHRDLVHAKTGLYLTPYYSAPKVQWLFENDPEIRAAKESGNLRISPVATHILWKLSRGDIFIVDPSLAQRTLLMDSRALRWDEELLHLFGVQRESLPAITTSSGELGVIPRKGRKIPVFAMMGDQQAAALGLGAEETDSGILNYGTGAFFLVNAGTQMRSIPGLLSSVAWHRKGKDCEYFQEGTVHAAGTSFEWLKTNLGLLKRIEDVDEMCRKSDRRILALQAIGGLGAPRWDYATFTTYMGMSSATRPRDIVRAVTEGIAFLIADIWESLREAGMTVKKIRASGGLSELSYLLQFQANILQMPIERLAQNEATAAGVALLAAEQAGVPWASKLRAHDADRAFNPSMSAEEASKLLAGWRLFVSSQQKLSAELRRLGVLG